MRVFIQFGDERHCLDVSIGQTVGEMKQMLRRKFDLNTVQNEDEDNNLVMIIRFAGGSLLDDWIYSDLNIPSGVTLKCELVENVKSYLNVFCVYSGETLRFTESFSVWETKVSELRCMIMNKTGLHVSVFRLVTEEDGMEMFDCNYLKNYNVNLGDTIRLETWDGWANFLKAATRGHLTPTLKHMVSLSDDPLVAKYQLRVALFMAAHFDYHQLSALLLKSGARSDEPVGEHPVREWCNREVHIDHLKTPVHQAAQQGSLTCLRLFIYHNYACILVKEGNGLTPCNIARRFKQTECFKLLIAEQFRSRSMDGLTITLYAKIKKWSERARDRALIFHKHNPSPLLLAMEKRTYRKAAVGQKVYIDGYGKRLQTSASRIELSLVQNDKKKPTSTETGESGINSKTHKAIKAPCSHIESRNDHILFPDDGRESGNFEELNEFSGDKASHNCSKVISSRNSYDSLPAVTDSRCHGKASKLDFINDSQQQTVNAIQKHKRAHHGSYRWKEPSKDNLKQNHDEKLPRNLGQEDDRNLITPRVIHNVTGNFPLLNNNYIDNNSLVSEKVEKLSVNEEHERIFVTESILNFKEKTSKPHRYSWSPVEDPNDENDRSKMPPIRSQTRHIQSPPESLNQHNIQRFNSKELTSKRRSEDNSVHKAEARHVFRKRTMSEDPALHSTAIFRHMTGLDIRKTAKASLEVATTFNKMSWLQQVQLAIDLNKNTFKRQVFSRTTK